MKRCPSCDRTFEEEWLAFCTQDGTTLIDDVFGSPEPPPTIMAPASSDRPAWQTPSAELPPSSPEWRPPPSPVREWQPPPPPAIQAPTKNLAIASMVLGIISITIGWICFGPFSGIAAIVLGAVSLSQIKKTPERVGGKPMAVTGIVTGGIAVLLYGGLMLFSILVSVAGNL